MFFRARIGGTVYELSRLTLGGARLLKKHFDVDDVVDSVNYTDPDVLAGLVYLAMHEADPEVHHLDLIARVEALDLADFEEIGDTEEQAEAGSEEVPTQAGEDPAAEDPPAEQLPETTTDSGSATTLAAPGTPASPASTG